MNRQSRSSLLEGQRKESKVATYHPDQRRSDPISWSRRHRLLLVAVVLVAIVIAVVVFLAYSGGSSNGGGYG